MSILIRNIALVVLPLVILTAAAVSSVLLSQYPLKTTLDTELMVLTNTDMMRCAKAAYMLCDQAHEAGIPVDADSVTDRVRSMTVGKTGYVFAIQGSGDTRGAYVIAPDDGSTGKVLWDLMDADGDYFIRDMIEGAKSAPPGEVIYVTYAYKHPETSLLADKAAACIYHEPSDLVIGAGAYVSDYKDALYSIERSAHYTMLLIVLGGLIMTVFSSFIAGIVSIKDLNQAKAG